MINSGWLMIDKLWNRRLHHVQRKQGPTHLGRFFPMSVGLKTKSCCRFLCPGSVPVSPVFGLDWLNEIGPIEIHRVSWITVPWCLDGPSLIKFIRGCPDCLSIFQGAPSLINSQLLRTNTRLSQILLLTNSRIHILWHMRGIRWHVSCEMMVDVRPTNRSIPFFVQRLEG